MNRFELPLEMLKYDRLAIFEKGFFNTRFDRIYFYGAAEVFQFQAGNWHKLDDFLEKHKTNYIYTAIGYDLKNQIETINLPITGPVNFPDLELVVPEKVVLETNGERTTIFQTKQKSNSDFYLNQAIHHNKTETSFFLQTDYQGYLEKVIQLKNYIQSGNIYEINFCIESIRCNCNLDVIKTYEKIGRAHV